MSNPKTARSVCLIAVTLVLAACNGQPQPELSASEIQAQEAATVIEEGGKDYTAPAFVISSPSHYYVCKVLHG